MTNQVIDLSVGVRPAVRIGPAAIEYSLWQQRGRAELAAGSDGQVLAATNERPIRKDVTASPQAQFIFG